MNVRSLLWARRAMPGISQTSSTRVTEQNAQENRDGY
jgi:hypothetical protein